MFSYMRAALLLILILANGCVFDKSGIGVVDMTFSDSSCESSSCGQDLKADSSVIDTSTDGLPPDQLSPDMLAPDTMAPDTLKPDTNPPCKGAGSAGSIKLSCQATGNNCKQGSVTDVTTALNNIVFFDSSFTFDGGQPVGYGSLTPSKGNLACNGTLSLKWTLPAGDLTTITLILTFTGGDGKKFAKTVQVTTIK